MKLLRLLLLLPALACAQTYYNQTTAGPTTELAPLTATGSTTARTLADRAAEVVNVRDYGAKGNTISGAYTVSISSGNTALTATGAAFTSTDVGKVIEVAGAGAAAGILHTTISAVGDSSHLTLAAAASTTVTATAQIVMYGTNDSAAFNGAVARVNTLCAAQAPNRLLIPAGVYLLDAAITQFAVHCAGNVAGAGDLQSVIQTTSAFGGAVFSWDEAWANTGQTGASYDALNTYIGGQIADLALRSNTGYSGQNGLMFIDRNDDFLLSNVKISYFNGCALCIGTVLNTATQAYMRESKFYNLFVWESGTSSAPAVWLSCITTGGGDCTNTLKFYGLDIFNSTSVGLQIDNSSATGSTRIIDFFGLRVEKSVSASADLIRIGDTTNTGGVNSVNIFGLHEYSIPATGFGVHLALPTNNIYSVNIIGGDIGSGSGGGLKVDAGHAFSFQDMTFGVSGTHLTVGPHSGLGCCVRLTYNNSTAITTSIDATSTAYVLTGGVAETTGTRWGVDAGGNLNAQTITGTTGTFTTVTTSQGSNIRFQWGIPVGVPPSGFFANNGVYVVGQAPSSSATLSVSATSGSVTATFSAATLLGTANDVGRIITILDSTYKYCTITANTSTTVATCTISGGTLSGTGPFANANLWLTGFQVNNNTAFSVMLPTAFAAVYFNIPVNVISASTPAGVYYATCASTTVCTVFNNALASGAPTIPGSPTAFSTTGTGAFTQSTSQVTLLTLVIPANSMGTQGSLVIDTRGLRVSNANTITIQDTFGGTAVAQSSTASTYWYPLIRTIRNTGATNSQIYLPVAANIATDLTTNVNTTLVYGSADTTAPLNLLVKAQLTTTGLDWFFNLGGTITTNYSP